MIDLRSDTVTRPTGQMLEAMMQAEVGDDVFGEDVSINKLELKIAEMFGHETALFCPSGTMTNQIACNVHTQPGDEIICDRLSHVYNYEGGGLARNSGVSVRLLNGDRGRFTVDNVLENINPDDVHFPVSRLVVIENSCNKGGGSVWDIQQIEAISAACRERGLKLHLDGARLFNALAESGQSPLVVGPLFDSISICLSKGLGAPVGSLLLGNDEFIREARRTRKVWGGGMRQAGYLAAAGIFALENHIDRLSDDHRRARRLGDALAAQNYVRNVLPVDTNIVIFNLVAGYSAAAVVAKLEATGILAIDMGPESVRMVTHLDINDEMVDTVIGRLKTIRL